MAASVLLQRRAAAVTAAALVGGTAFYPRVAHAEEVQERHFSKKPIYDDDFHYPSPPSKPSPRASAIVAAASPAAPSPSKALPTEPTSATLPLAETTPSPTTVTTKRTPTPTARLAAQIRQGRLFLYHQACTAEDAVNNAMSRAFSLEQSFTSTIASLAPARESGERLMPGVIYVLVAGMAGSIVARNRNVLLRGAAPLALGLGAAWVVLPVTMGNVSALAWRYEQRFPAVARAHIAARGNVDKGVSFARVHGDLAARKVTETVGEVRETVEGWVRKGK